MVPGPEGSHPGCVRIAQQRLFGQDLVEPFQVLIRHRARRYLSVGKPAEEAGDPDPVRLEFDATVETGPGLRHRRRVAPLHYWSEERKGRPQQAPHIVPAGRGDAHRRRRGVLQLGAQAPQICGDPGWIPAKHPGHSADRGRHVLAPAVRHGGCRDGRKNVGQGRS